MISLKSKQQRLILFSINPMTDIECVFESMTGKGSIFISNYAAAQDIALLQSKGIKAILSVARSGLVQHSREDVPYYLYLPADDHEQYQLYKFFNQTFDFIEQSRRHTNVLVHCMAGISRSVTIVIAYLLKKFKCSLGEVIMMLQRKRSKINPNKGFIQQLKKYAQQEGLKCNFDYEEVPTLKERSCSKGKQQHSKSKEKGISQYGLTNPLAKGYQEKKQKKRVEKTAATKEDISQLRKKSEEKKDIALPVSPPKISKIQKATIQEAQKPFMDLSPVKKKCSFDSRATARKQKMSIEEKIMKVREKIQHKEELRKVSLEKKASGDKEPLLNKQNKVQNLRSTLQPKKTSSKHLSQYFTLYSKHHPVTLSLAHHDEKMNPSKRYRDGHEKNEEQADQFQVDFCETEEDICPKELRVEPRALYSKIQHKKVSRGNP